jgi:hypothetical protein
VPITIGFFAIPEIIDLAVQGTSIAGGETSRLGGVMQGVKDTFHHWWLVIRCSAIGTFTAIIPGMGGATTQWLAYAHAVQSSPDKERFGKGAIEGVLGPGASNNSTLGGSLLTTVAFGIPASVSMAILMGAFLIQGIIPGPEMLIPEPKGHLALTFSFVWINVFSNIITVGVCFLILNQLVKVTRIRASLLIPCILLLIYIGAFAEKNSFEDLILVLIFGVLGWVMQRLNWPRPPVLLGLVLGPLAENRLFLSHKMYGFTWLLRPVVLLLIALTAGGAFYSIWRARAQKRKKDSRETSDEKSALQDTRARLKFSWEMVFSLIIVVMFGYALWDSRDFDIRAGLFPWAVGFPCLGLAIIQFIKDLKTKENKSGEDLDPLSLARSEVPIDVVNRRTAGIIVWIVAYFVGIWLLGFSFGVTLCTFIQLKIGYREKWPITLILSAITFLFIDGFFGRILHVPLYPGQLFAWLKFSPL